MRAHKNFPNCISNNDFSEMFVIIVEKASLTFIWNSAAVISPKAKPEHTRVFDIYVDIYWDFIDFRIFGGGNSRNAAERRGKLPDLIPKLNTILLPSPFFASLNASSPKKKGTLWNSWSEKQ